MLKFSGRMVLLFLVPKWKIIAKNTNLETTCQIFSPFEQLQINFENEKPVGNH